MSKYYTVPRKRNRFDPASTKPFKLSRSKIDLFLNCPRCFYQDRRFGVGTPPGYPFTLNSAVDALLKKEFDQYRARQEPHPLMTANGIDAVPFAHPQLDAWRDSLRRGIQYHDEATNLVLTGGVDDVWVTPEGELIIVDYKATAKTEKVNIDADWQIGYKRQMEIYAWLFHKNGFPVHSLGYFVYANGRLNRPSFDQRLEFEVSVLVYKLDDSWVDGAIQRAYACLVGELVPEAGEDCDFCRYVAALAALKSNPT